MRKIAMLLFAGAALATVAYGQESSPAQNAPAAEQKQAIAEKAKCCTEGAKCCEEQKDCCKPQAAKKANAKHQHGQPETKGCCK